MKLCDLRPEYISFEDRAAPGQAVWTTDFPRESPLYHHLTKRGSVLVLQTKEKDATGHIFRGRGGYVLLKHVGKYRDSEREGPYESLEALLVVLMIEDKWGWAI